MSETTTTETAPVETPKAAPAVKTTKAKKAAKTPKAATKARPPAKELMAKRTRMTFGPSYLNGVLGGVHRDVGKMVVHAHALGLGAKSDLERLSIETLRTRLADAILSAGDSAPTSVRI